MAAMIRRLLVTAVLLIAALGGFWGLFDGEAGFMSPVGWVFVGFAALAWHKWSLISGAFSPGLFDGLCARDDRAYRADDDHYRRDGQRNYCERE
jgi:hypothetical protein